ncbi:MAG: sensor histidine kinase [Coriobacteriales bacterium]|nr:sensor histidine kinase [Coriobacteriales bacterium]
MNFISFLRGKVFYLTAVFFTAAVTVLLITFVFRIEFAFALLAISVLVGGCLIALVPEYLVKQRYYNELEDTLAHLDKKYLLAAVLVYPEFEEGKILYDALVTTGKSMNDEIARFARASREYREYVEMWVHEIKTPIAGMKLMSENIHNRELLIELDRIDFLVDQALYYARSNTVEEDYQIRQITLDSLVGIVLKSNSRLLIAHKISIHTANLAFGVLTDAKWTVFILRQLIDNSVKYGASSLEFTAKENEGSVTLLLRDNGVGIEEKDLDRIFEKGFTGENGRRFGKATGLGLYLCKKLCDKMGLEILAQSKPGEGTTMEIVFPRRNLFA